jgi:hypothetical protein
VLVAAARQALEVAKVAPDIARTVQLPLLFLKNKLPTTSGLSLLPCKLSLKRLPPISSKLFGVD